MPLFPENWMLVFVRAGAFLLVLPPFSTPNVQRQVRTGLAALLAVLIAPGLPAPPPVPNVSTLLGLMSLEAVTGLFMGFMTRMVFYVADFAGRLVANEMGLNLGQMFNPLSGDQSQVPGMVLFYLAAIMMLCLDMHHWVLAGFQRSYGFLPAGGAHLQQAVFEHLLQQTGRLFVVSVQVAAPVIAVSFIVTLLFSVLGRAVPQMAVFTESLGIRMTCGLVIFGLTLQIMAQHLLNYLHRLPEDILLLSALLGGTR